MMGTEPRGRGAVGSLCRWLRLSHEVESKAILRAEEGQEEVMGVC